MANSTTKAKKPNEKTFKLRIEFTAEKFDEKDGKIEFDAAVKEWYEKIGKASLQLYFHDSVEVTYNSYLKNFHFTDTVDKQA